jgi:hypothetical protein
LLKPKRFLSVKSFCHRFLEGFWGVLGSFCMGFLADFWLQKIFGGAGFLALYKCTL